MALLVRVLVSAGIIFCGRLPGLRVRIGEGGAGEAGRKCKRGAYEIAWLSGRLSAGKLRQLPTYPAPVLALASPTFKEWGTLDLYLMRFAIAPSPPVTSFREKEHVGH